MGDEDDSETDDEARWVSSLLFWVSWAHVSLVGGHRRHEGLAIHQRLGRGPGSCETLHPKPSTLNPKPEDHQRPSESLLRLSPALN